MMGGENIQHSQEKLPKSYSKNTPGENIKNAAILRGGAFFETPSLCFTAVFAGIAGIYGIVSLPLS